MLYGKWFSRKKTLIPLAHVFGLVVLHEELA